MDDEDVRHFAKAVAAMYVNLRDRIRDSQVQILRADSLPKGLEDYVSELDTGVGQFIRSHLSPTFREVQFISEEDFVNIDSVISYSDALAGTSGTVCLIDPIDGSQNIDAGLFLFGSCLTLLRNGIPVMAAAVDLTSGEIVALSCAGSGPVIWHSGFYGEPISSVYGPSRHSVSRRGGPYLSLLRGSITDAVPSQFELLERSFANCAGRVFQTRAPVIDLFMLLRGSVSAICGYELTGFETPAVSYICGCFELDMTMPVHSALALTGDFPLTVFAREDDLDWVITALRHSGVGR